MEKKTVDEFRKKSEVWTVVQLTVEKYDVTCMPAC